MNKKLALLAFSFFSLSGAAQAALVGRDLNGSGSSFEAYYDTELNITWLTDGSANVLMNWAAAKNWAANLSFTDGVNVYDNWRLPSTLQPDASCSVQTHISYGYNCTGSEMGHLFYAELGGVAGQSILTSTDPNVLKFNNLQSSDYWSGTEFVLAADGAWQFYFAMGFQYVVNAYATVNAYALAVSPGDVAAVPEPDAWAMLLTGLGLLGFVVHRRNKKEALSTLWAG